MQPKLYTIKESDAGLVDLAPIANTSETHRFMYSIKFKGVNPVGANALVVAKSAAHAIQLLQATLFFNYSRLYSHNLNLPYSAVTVLAQAHSNQQSYCWIISDGDY